jgi:phage gp45-like
MTDDQIKQLASLITQRESAENDVKTAEANVEAAKKRLAQVDGNIEKARSGKSETTTDETRHAKK